jgi:hypothetical protein
MGLQVEELAADDSRFAGLTLPTSPSLGFAQALSRSLDYTGHSSLLVRNTESVVSP